MLKTKIFTILFACISFFGFSQKSFNVHESKVNKQLLKLRLAVDDESKLIANQVLVDTLKSVLHIEGAFDHPFATLKSMGSIKSPDKKFRFFNWNIELANQSQKYFCIMMIYDSRKKSYKLIEFKDNSFLLPPKPTNTLTPYNWYGALYYKIIPKSRGSKTYYTLLGYDANNNTSTVKIVDVLTISGTKVKLGAPIFITNDGVEKRLFFEYSKMATMSMTFDKNRDMIIMDHLAPESPNLKGFKEYYVPDLTYDGMVFSKGKWSTHNNVIAVNPAGKKKIKIMAQNGNGQLESREVNNKWNSPNDKNSPIDNGNHEAITPEKEAKLSDKDMIRKKKKEARKQNNDSVYPNTNKRKRKKKKSRSILDY